MGRGQASHDRGENWPDGSVREPTGCTSASSTSSRIWRERFRVGRRHVGPGTGATGVLSGDGNALGRSRFMVCE